MKRSIVITLILTFFASSFIVTAVQQWRFAKLVQDDVAYLGERIANVPHDAPWSRSRGSFPDGIHEELGLDSKVMNIFAALNQLSAIALAVTLAVALRCCRKGRQTK
jgi:hypothetical protein